MIGNAATVMLAVVMAAGAARGDDRCHGARVRRSWATRCATSRRSRAADAVLDDRTGDRPSCAVCGAGIDRH